MKEKVFTIRIKRSGETLKEVAHNSLQARRRVAKICGFSISELVIERVEIVETIPYR